MPRRAVKNVVTPRSGFEVLLRAAASDTEPAAHALACLAAMEHLPAKELSHECFHTDKASLEVSASPGCVGCRTDRSTPRERPAAQITRLPAQNGGAAGN